MTTRYVGKGGSDSNDGLSWANRKLTFTGVEDTPVAAGDIIYVGAGTYREKLTCDVSGSAGSLITYIGDVGGAYTDGVGGAIRLTASDNDQTDTRDYALDMGARTHRMFRGIQFDGGTSYPCYGTGTDLTIEDCAVTRGPIMFAESYTNNVVQRCILLLSPDYGVRFYGAALRDASGCYIDNNLFISTASAAIYLNNVEDVIIRNNTILGCSYGILVNNSGTTNLAVANNNILAGCGYGMYAFGAGQITENYNNFYQNGTDRNNVSTGANSTSYIPGFDLPRLLANYSLPSPLLGSLAAYSALRAITGASERSDDFFGRTRPATASKNSWGAVQHQGGEYSTTQAQGGSASLKLPDVGRVQFIIPVTNVSTTISVYVYREANYAGTNPQMVIRQPGQSARTTTDTGSASGWNKLTDTFTPAASPPWVVVEVVSNNTATSGSYAVYVDTLEVA